MVVYLNNDWSSGRLPSDALGHSRSRRILRNGKPKHVDYCRCNIWQHSDNEDEFPKLGRAPGSLKIFPAIEYGGSSNQERHDILLSKRCSDVDPWVEDRLLGYKGKQLDRKERGRCSELFGG